jgi:YD repeat-containing protein
MKLAIIFSLLFSLGFAQEKHSTSDFHLSNDVVKYESVEYVYNSTIKNFEVSKTQILEFKEGKLIQKTYKENSIYGAIMNRVEKYIYNEKGQLIKIEAEGKPTYQYNYDKSGKLIKIVFDRKSEPAITEDFIYDKKGNLIKWIKKSGDLTSEEKLFSDYQSKNNYKCKYNYYKYQKNEILFTDEIVVKNGLEISNRHISYDPKSEQTSTFSYDNYGNLVEQKVSDGTVYQYVFAYDEKGNVIKERSKDVAELYSNFSKVTFKDGTTSGSTTFAPYFTKGIQQPILLMAMNKNPKEKYKVMKTGPVQYQVKNSKGEIVPINPKESMIFEEKDMVFYDAKTNETVVIFGLFTNEYNPNQWYDAVTYNSPTGKYIVVNTDWNFFIIEKGNVVESSQYKLHKGIDGNTLVIAENGKEKYFVPYLDQMQALVIYPLELISK